MQSLINAESIISLHKDRIIDWKQNGVEHIHSEFYKLVEENHAFNYQLWHVEDKARRDDMGYEYVYKAKREIDYFNQQRNNRMEAMDEWLYTQLKPASHEICPVNSESPGMIIDRLSILSLKAYHMNLQTLRDDVHEDHKKNCLLKVEVIQTQLKQLSHCLQELLNDVESKTRTFRVYHQFKMYNDPNLNPELYTTK